MTRNGPRLQSTALLAFALAGACDGARTPPPPASVTEASTPPSFAPSAAPPAPSAKPLSHSDSPPAASATGGGLPPLSADSAWVELELERFAPAIVSLPLGARGPKPVILVAHGAGDNPSWQCEWWHNLVQNRAFLLCPRGITAGRLPSGNMGYAYKSEPALERESLAAIAALAARYGPYVDQKAMVYAGFSQGASFGVPFLSRHAELFRAAILLEGGTQPSAWTDARARALGRGGLRRVLLGCGRESCAQSAQRLSRRLEAAGLEVRVFHAQGAGHTYAGTGVERETYAAFPWIIEGDGRWAEATAAGARQ